MNHKRQSFAKKGFKIYMHVCLFINIKKWSEVSRKFSIQVIDKIAGQS